MNQVILLNLGRKKSDTFYSVTKQIKIFLLWQIQKKKKWNSLDQILTD